jgi:hypothetical protein
VIPAPRTVAQDGIRLLFRVSTDQAPSFNGFKKKKTEFFKAMEKL